MIVAIGDAVAMNETLNQTDTRQVIPDTPKGHAGSPGNARTDAQAEANRRSEQEDLAHLLERAEKGDRAVLPELCAALDADKRLWKTYGDLAQHAEAALGMLVAGNNLLLAESLKRTLSAMKTELGGQVPSPLERLLIERVTATWLQVNYFDGLVAQAKETKNAHWRVLERHRDSAGRRHLAAIKALATIRKLLAPAPSPLEIASRMNVPESVARRSREGFAGKVLVPN
jgi:hypothetical protein